MGFSEKKKAQVTVKKLLLTGAVLLISFLCLKDKAFSADDTETSEISIFSNSLTFFQQDYKKENINILAEDKIKGDIDEGIVSATTPNVAVCINTNIEGQDYSSGESSGQNERKAPVEYAVKEGDTVSTIATVFGLKTQTLLWANNLDVLSLVHPGDKLTIPPEDGVMYKVKKGDTLGAIAKKYSSDTSEIMDFNQIDSSDSIVEGQMLFLPGAKILAPTPTPTPSRSSSSLASSRSTSTVSSPVIRRSSSGSGHRFPYGYCTWYAAQKRGGVPWGGNAKEWLTNARAAGYATGSQPVPGAIMVTRESWWGHVAYVEGVSGGSVTVSEMNMAGYGVISRRTISTDSWVIRGYIY